MSFNGFDIHDPENEVDTSDQRIEFDEIVHQTSNAVLFRFEKEKFWLPKKEIDIDENNMMVYAPYWVRVKRIPISPFTKG